MDFDCLLTVFNGTIEQDIENLENTQFGQLVDEGAGDVSVMDFTKEVGMRLIFLVYFESLFLLKLYNLIFHLTKDKNGSLLAPVFVGHRLIV